jgi:hypothetical protein
LLPASPQGFDGEDNLLAYTTQDNIPRDHTTLSQSSFSNIEKDLQGVGSHLTMGGGEQPPTLTQDEVQEANVERDEASWPAIKIDLPEGFGADWNADDDLEALWWKNSQDAPSIGNSQVNASTQASDLALWWTNSQDAPSNGNDQANTSQQAGVVAFQAEYRPAATQDLNERSIETTTWPKVSEHHAANLRSNEHSRSHLHSDRQSYLQSSWDPKTSQQGMQGLWTRDQLTATANYGPVQDQFSVSWETTPGLTTGLRTESFVSDNSSAADPTMSDRMHAPGPEEVDTVTSFGGFPTIKDTTTQYHTPNMMLEHSSAYEPAFNMGEALFDMGSYQNQFVMAGDSTSVHPSHASISTGKGLPDEKSMNPLYEYDLPDAHPSANDGPFYGYT